MLLTTRLAYSSAFLSVALLSYFSFVFPKPRYKPEKSELVALIYFLFCIAGSVFSASDLVVGTITIQPGLTSVGTGPLYWGYLALLVAIFALLARNLLKSRRDPTVSKIGRSQITMVLLGIGASFVAGIITNGILPVVVSNWNYARVGPFLSVLLVGSVTFSIIRNRLFDIRSVVARSVTYTLVLTTLGGFYAAAVFGLSSVFFPSQSSNRTELFANTLLALILAFTFQPLRRFFERGTNRFFYHDHYDSQEVLNEFSKILVSELDLGRLLKKSLENLCESVHIQFGQMVIFNHERVYRVEHYGPLPRRLMVAPELHTLNRSMLVADELSGGARKALMDSHGVRVSLMLSSRSEFVGYLLLGDKLSGDIYSNQDIELLEIISKELAVAIQNAKAYAEISEFNVTLQARVDHATNRLRVANRHLKELDKAKDEFISMASHQLRTPLTTIKGYLSMLSEGDAGKISADQKQFVQYAFDSSERMVRLISDLLNVSRLSAGKFLIQRRPTDMVAMIDDEVRQLMPHAKAKNVQLIFDRPAEPLPPAQIDDNKTRQVIMNFIDNAIYYTPAGEVRVKLRQTGEMVRLEVHDTGIGVPEDARKKLFTKFYRAGNAQVVRPDGTGLGLYLAKRVVQDQGGTIIFNSVEGKGSTFGFELPLKPPPAHTSSTHPEEQHGRSRTAVQQ
jgi:signal transduction histidine kinase